MDTQKVDTLSWLLEFKIQIYDLVVMKHFTLYQSALTRNSIKSVLKIFQNKDFLF